MTADLDTSLLRLNSRAAANMGFASGGLMGKLGALCYY